MAARGKRGAAGAWVLVVGALVVLAGAGGVVGLSSWRTEREIAALRSAGALPSLAPSAEARALRMRLAASRKGFEQRFQTWQAAEPTRGEPCAPWEWSEEHRPKLAARVVELGPLLDELEALLATPEARALLERDEPVEGAPSTLAETRREVHALLARALVLAEQPGGSERAARALASALEFARLRSDGSLCGWQATLNVQASVLDVAARLASQPAFDLRALRAELEPVLARLDPRASLSRALRREIAALLEEPEESASRCSCLLPSFARRAAWRRRLLEELARFEPRLDASWATLAAGGELARASDLPQLDAEVLAVPAFATERRVRLARVALALGASLERSPRPPRSLDALADALGGALGGALPLDPLGERPFDYRREGGVAVLRLSDAGAAAERASSSRLWRLAP